MKIKFEVRNPNDEAETEAWLCEADSAKDAARQYLAAFWSAEQRGPEWGDVAGKWWSPTYEGDIDGADLEITAIESASSEEEATALIECRGNPPGNPARSKKKGRRADAHVR